MRRLTEDLAKQFLRARGLPVPAGHSAQSAEDAVRLAADMTQGAVIKALVPAGRRGQSGGVHMVEDAQACRVVAEKLLGSVISGFTVRRVLVEERVSIDRELYVCFTLRAECPEVLVSTSGGIAIEQAIESHPERLVRAQIDPLRGLTPWQATELWLRAGVHERTLPALSTLTSELYDAFRAADALLLEINPLALTHDGALSLVGTMMAVDDCALYRHPAWGTNADGEDLPSNPRERDVAIANLTLPGGECSYIELAGDIGLLVGGGGAGLYQHDLILELGGRPANHCVTPPTGSDNRKMKAVIRAILDHPKLRGLLVGFNFAQMARADIRVRSLVEVLDETAPRHAKLPIVIRLFGAGEDEARVMVAGRPNIHYVARGTTLRAAVQFVVQLAAGSSATALR